MANTVYKYLMNHLFNKNIDNKLKYLDVKDISEKNKIVKEQIQRCFLIFSNLGNLSSDWEDMDNLIVTRLGVEETKYLFKQWDIEIFTADEDKLETLANMVIPAITPNIIYKEPAPNNLDFYNTGLELRDCFFYEFKEEALILHASVLIEKIFGVTELFVPQVKLLVDIDPAFSELS